MSHIEPLLLYVESDSVHCMVGLQRECFAHSLASECNAALQITLPYRDKKHALQNTHLHSTHTLTHTHTRSIQFNTCYLSVKYPIYIIILQCVGRRLTVARCDCRGSAARRLIRYNTVGAYVKYTVNCTYNSSVKQ